MMDKQPSSDVAFTATVRSVQERRGSRIAHRRMEERYGWQTRPCCARFSMIAWLALLLSLGSVAIGADMDGVMMQNGKMMMMKDGKPAGPMDHAITMSDGTVVAPDATISFKDGKQGHMTNGQMMMMDGHIMQGESASGMHE